MEHVNHSLTLEELNSLATAEAEAAYEAAAHAADRLRRYAHLEGLIAEHADTSEEYRQVAKHWSERAASRAETLMEWARESVGP